MVHLILTKNNTTIRVFDDTRKGFYIVETVTDKGNGFCSQSMEFWKGKANALRCAKQKYIRL